MPITADLPQVPFSSYDEVASSGVPRTVLERVIARDGKSKNYGDLLPLDGGTVGIAHFAVGGLAALYRQMDTVKYFSKSQEEMAASYAAACRPPGKTGNDTGWGCYTRGWWRTGMQAFLASADSPAIQNSAWAAMMRPVVETALQHGWRDPRSMAIALGIANSMGRGGYATLAGKQRWDAEKTLEAYVGGNAHRARRRAAIDQQFPRAAQQGQP
jgi:hypothetical protein